MKTQSSAYYPTAYFRERARGGGTVGTVVCPDGIVEVCLNDVWKQPGYQNVSFDTAFAGRRYWMFDKRPPSRTLTERGAAMLARRWHAQIVREVTS